MAPPVGPFGYIVACHHLALPFNILCSPVQALPALIRFALQTCAPILLSQTGPLGQQGEPQKKRERYRTPCWTIRHYFYLFSSSYRYIRGYPFACPLATHQVCFANLRTNSAFADWSVRTTGEATKKRENACPLFFLWLPLLDSNQRPSG